MNPKVLILILNYNGLKALGHVLFESIESALQINYDNLDVAVIDNASSDGSDIMIENRFQKDITLIKHNRNYGYAGGNELGFQRYVREKGVPEYLIIMNNDYIIKNPDFIKNAVKTLENRETIALAQGINLMRNGRRIENTGTFIGSTYFYIWGRCYGLSLSECPERPSYVSFATGAFFIIKVKPVLSIRGVIFRPELFMYYDEVELAFNMWTHGYRCLALPELAGIHMFSATVKHFKTPSYYFGYRNALVARDILSPRTKVISTSLSIQGLLIRSAGLILRGKREDMRYMWRGTIDGLFSKPLTKVVRGPYEPLILIPRFPKMHVYLSSRVVYQDVQTLTIDDKMLKSSKRPFLIKI